MFCVDCGTGICNKVSFGPFNFTVARPLPLSALGVTTAAVSLRYENEHNT